MNTQIKIYAQLVAELNAEVAQEKASKVEFFVKMNEALELIQSLEQKVQELEKQIAEHTQENEMTPDDVTVETTQYRE